MKMIDQQVKAKELLEKLKLITEGNLKEKEKLEKKLEKISNPTKSVDYMKFMRNADVLVKAFGFIENNGNHTFNSEKLSTSPSGLIKLFTKYQNSFSDQEYWENLKYVYTMQDYQQIPYALFVELFNSKRSQREFLMNDEEKLFFEQLPEKITIYRGGAKNETQEGFGISWTLDKTIAEMFVTRKSYLKDEMIVHELEITKSKAVAYFNERTEAEIIYLS